MRTILRILDRLEEILIATLLAAATFLIFLAVMHRYLSGIPALFDLTSRIHLSWAQEAAIYMLVWMAKFGAAYGVRTGIHVGVDVLVNRLPPRSRHWVTMVSLLAGALFTSIIAVMGARFVAGLYDTEQTTPDLELPSWLVYLAIPLGSSLMCFRFLQVAWTFWRTGEIPHHDHSFVEGVDETPEAGREVAR